MASKRSVLANCLIEQNTLLLNKSDVLSKPFRRKAIVSELGFVETH
jgi:hypothetical protein